MVRKILSAISACLVLVTAAAAGAKEPADTYRDVQKTLGLVPSFVKSLPAVAVPGAWADMKGLELNPKTAIPGKYKELIGLAVAAQIPCRYCILFHTEAAKLQGATQAELDEAVVMASLTRKFSTLLNGTQQDEAQFQNDLQRLIAYATKPHSEAAAAPVTDAASAYRDMQRTFGFVPTFFRAYPESAIAGAWRLFRDVEANPKTAIPPKYKELIGLAVAAQIPCRYCIVAHTEFARLGGASEGELREAVGMAALTRQWSTWLNGSQADEATFRREAQQIINLARKAAHR